MKYLLDKNLYEILDKKNPTFEEVYEVAVSLEQGFQAADP
jgi:hypothetical protein